ncbi:MAG TPA: mechanosensitive ion channel family protein [Acidimicrobiales bacterium]|nr:mechanosensitive ion channel family protein [Acidimicrobiales bacterium]
MSPLLGHAETVITACGEADQAGRLCAGIFGLTSNESLARNADLFLAKPTKIALIVILAMVATWLLRRGIRRFTRGLKSVTAEGAANVGDRSPGALLRTGGRTSARTVQRAETIGTLLVSAAGFMVWGMAGLMVLGELGVNLGPLVAGAGIAGIALGFGAQNLVRDFFSGFFILIEDQYGVGDVIDVGPATGTVEGISLRATRLRDVEGNVWHIPNGEIARVANKSQEWSRALLDIQVSYQTPTDDAVRVIERVAEGLHDDPEWSACILSTPEVWGVEELAADGVTIRLVVQTQPLTQWKVARELRARIKKEFDAEGIEIPFPQRTIWHRNEEDREPVGSGVSSER